MNTSIYTTIGAPTGIVNSTGTYTVPAGINHGVLGSIRPGNVICDSLEVRGRSVLEALETMERRLLAAEAQIAIINRDIELEGRWVDLAKVAAEYNILLQEIKEKEEAWEILRK